MPAAARSPLPALLAVLALILLLPAPHALAQGTSVYRNDFVASQARRVEAEILGETEHPNRPSRELLQEGRARLAAGDPRGALDRFQQAIRVNPTSHTLWSAYARAAIAIAPEDWSERWTLQERAVGAGWNAYRLAENPAETAAGLAVLGEAFAAREQWRDALNALAASLSVMEAPEVRARWADLRSQWGFRILSYSVDADAAAPRVCFLFSETLPPRVDLAPFVAVAGASGTAVTSNESELCVDGLRHGERYAIVLRPGIPSTVGESLERAADYEIYVRDRAPQARFTGRNYVLPRTGQEGIPVVTTNTDEVAIAIHRIGDRSLLPTVRSDEFLAQLSRWSADEIARERGAPIWEGTLAVEMRRNEDVVTAFPVSEAIGDLEPGVYVMTARADPTADAEDDWNPRATQWFVVSDLGLTAISARDGVHVLVRSLASAEPLEGVSVRLVARNNEVLATLETDASGRVRFDPGLARGEGGLAAGLVTAEARGDYGFLDLGQAAFDLTDRGVSGRPIAGALEAFVYPERGVYRSGEIVHLTAILRDAQADAAPGLPLTLVVRRPDGVEARREALPDQGLGGRVLSLPLLDDAMSGTWSVSAYVDPRGGPVGETRFLVEDYLPERIALALTPLAPALAAGAPAEIAIAADYLFGAPAADLALSGEVFVAAASQSAIPGLAGFTVGLSDEPVEGAFAEIEAGIRTDAAGRATLLAPVPEIAAPRPLEANVTVRIAEEGGRAVSRTITLPILPEGPVLAARALSQGLAEGDVAGFEIVAAAPDGTRLSTRARWSLYRVERRYQWFQSDGRWGFEPVTATERLASGALDVGAGAPARLEASVGWGRHRLEIVAEDHRIAPVSLAFDVGWSGDATARAPDLLELTLDRRDYAAGDTLVATLSPRFAGEATLAVVSDRIHHMETLAVTPDGARVEIPVSDDWGAGAYLVALAHRPLDAAARRQPGRALGLAWFGIDREARDLAMEIAPPAEMRPRNTLRVPVRLAGLAAGAQAHVVLAAVDVGILNLTRTEPPSPLAFFLGQKQIGAEFRDLYGHLIDGMQGTRGAIRSGGDAVSSGFAAPPPDQPPLALHSGIVTVGADGTAEIAFDIPAFDGTVRVMGIAWSQDRLGEASADVIVRDPVVVSATAPRFLAIGDEARVHLRLENVAGAPGDYEVEIVPGGPIDIPVGRRLASVALPAGGAASLSVPLTALAAGPAGIEIALRGPDLALARTLALSVEPGTAPVLRREVRDLAPGASLLLTRDLLADLHTGTGAVSVSATPFGRLDPAGMARALVAFPFGCTEQLVSQAMPLLYAEALGLSDGVVGEPRGEVIRSVVARVLSRQSASGAFGLWSARGNDDVWLDAYATDFLTRAREAGYEAPQRAIDLALERLRNHVANTTEIDAERGGALAYAAYVLARNGRPVMGDLRYLADARLDAFATPLARGQIAAGLALLGDGRRAEAAFQSAVGQLEAVQDQRGFRFDYGSRLRDAAGLMALVGEAGTARGALPRIAAAIEREAGAHPGLSTQEMAWMALAARTLADEARGIRLEVAGAVHEGAFAGRFDETALAGEGVALRNAGDRPVSIALTVTGNPLAQEPPVMQGFEIARSYYRLDGEPADPAQAAQNERLVVVLNVWTLDDVPGRIVIVDPLPAGFEIDNPALVDADSVAALPWLTREVEPDRVEYRDDRFVAGFDSFGFTQPAITLAYTIRVVHPGRFVHPPAYVEDMYRPERFGRTAFGEVEVR